MHFKYVQDNGGTHERLHASRLHRLLRDLPSNKLALALWLESDRMRSLAITDDNLTNQKEAVKQERRLRFDNEPYTNAIVEKWPALAYSAIFRIAFTDWLVRRSERGFDRRRVEVLQDLLCAEQCDAGDRWRLSNGRCEEAGRAIFRRYPGATAAAPSRHDGNGAQRRQDGDLSRSARPRAGRDDRLARAEAPYARIGMRSTCWMRC